MAKAGRGQTRRDSKRRVLRPGESVRADGKYQYKYHIDGKPHFVYSWKLEPTDKLPKGKKPCLALRELEKQVNTDLDLLVNIVDGQMTVCELVDRYLKTKTGVRQSTKQGYVTVQRLLAKESFGKKTIRSVKTSDAKLFLIKLQQEDGKSYSSIHTIRGVLRPAFQMAVDDDSLVKNPFGFQLAGVLVNDAVTREAITKDQMRKFLKFVHDDVVYCKYYEVVYILFHTGMRISEFCGLTLKDNSNIKSTLKKALDYIENPDKTDDKLLVSSFACSYETADIEFEMLLAQAIQKGNNLAHHLIQSFAHGEATPEQAHEIWKQLADEVLQGKYPYVLTTHIDKGHVHNHLIFCAVDMVNQRKYISNKQSYAYIRRTSDRLCKENGLSVVKPG